MSYLLAVLAAAANAAGNILQRKANADEAPELQLRLRLLWVLAHKRSWLVSLGLVILSFALLTAALSMGDLASVQPIVVIELPLTLIGGVRVFGGRLPLRDWIATLLLTGGVAGLLFFLHPRGGSSHPSVLVWISGLLVTAGVVSLLVITSGSGRSNRRAGMLGAAAGVTFGVTAALMKGMTQGFGGGFSGVLTSWHPYVMALSGIVGMLIMQSALNAGRLVAAQPGITLLDPCVAMLWGVLGFHEQVNGGASLALAVLCGLALAAGGLLLSTSPLLEDPPAFAVEVPDPPVELATR